MRLRLPRAPAQSDPIEAQTLQDVIAYLRAITPRGGPGVLVQTGAGGTTFSAPRRRTNGSDDAPVGGFCGRIWIAATRQHIEGWDTGGKAWIKITRGNPSYTISNHDEGPTGAWNVNEEWWNVNETHGAIRSYL